MDTFTFILEIIGTIAFASSGAMIAIEKKMDIFGVNILGATTAVGGGMMRDILGVTPPAAFSKPVYVLFSVLTATLLFTIVYTNPSILDSGFKSKYYDTIMLLCDTLGLGIFTVVGIQAAANVMNKDNAFFFVFVGVLTGVGGRRCNYRLDCDCRHPPPRFLFSLEFMENPLIRGFILFFRVLYS